MSHCVEKLPHECGSSDGLQVFETDGKFDGYCFACGTYVPDPYSDKPADFKPSRVGKSPEEIAKEIQEVSSDYPVLDLEDRRLRASSLDYFKIKVGVSEADGRTPALHYYPYFDKASRLLGYKVRLVSQKKFWVLGTTKKAAPFGWDQAVASGAKRLFITEGELDAVAVYQALVDNAKGGKWEHLVPAVISVANGAGSAAGIIAEYLNEITHHFKEVVIAFDQDEAGQKARAEVLKVLPTALTAELPAKDPNDCLIQGRSKALCNALLFKAEAPKNTRLILGSSLHEAGRKQAEWGYSWPWKSFNDLTRGIRLGETIYIGAGVKMGKSELVNALGAHLTTVHGWTVFFAKPEEANRKSWQMLLGKVTGNIFHDPNIKFDYEAYDKASKIVGDRALFLDLYQHMGWDALKADILYAVHMGAKAVFIDPITNLVNGASAGDQNTKLQEIAQELSAMAKDLDIVIFIFCHLKAPDSGDSHERGGKVLSHQFAGSRAMMRSCNMMIGLEGNKDPSFPPEKRNIRKLVLLEDREFGASGETVLYWNERTGLFTEIDG